MNAPKPCLGQSSALDHRIIFFKKAILAKVNPKYLWIILLTILLLVVNLLPNNLIDPFTYDIANEKLGKNTEVYRYKDNEFTPAFAQRFKSIDAIVYYVNKHVAPNASKREKLEALAKLIRQRFRHSYSVYGMRENWIAVLAGRLIWKDLAAKVIPDEILEGEVAACSQVGIIVMECCKKLEINTRKVELVGHYALEAEIDGKWYYVDANLKPNFSAINGRKSVEEILKNKEQFALYANTILDSASIAKKFSKVHYGRVNREPAPRAYLFQTITRILSHWSWLLLIGIGLLIVQSKEIKV
jgi:hypothetical protein